MTVEAKAKDLVAHFGDYAGDQEFGSCKTCQSMGLRNCAHPSECGEVVVTTVSKVCAIICCDEIIKELKSVEFDYDLENRFKGTTLSKTVIPYYEYVKKYIQTL
jgi:hypothetical protein